MSRLIFLSQLQQRADPRLQNIRITLETTRQEVLTYHEAAHAVMALTLGFESLPSVLKAGETCCERLDAYIDEIPADEEGFSPVLADVSSLVYNPWMEDTVQQAIETGLDEGPDYDLFAFVEASDRLKRMLGNTGLAWQMTLGVTNRLIENLLVVSMAGQAARPQKKVFEAPVLRREAQMPLVTAGSFDLVIPNP